MATPIDDAYSRVDAICDQESKTTVMFVGAPGAGKSSLINSLINIIDYDKDSRQKGINRYIPTAPKDMMGGHTLMREQVELTEALTIVDNRGWHDWGNEVALKELVAQINAQRAFVDDVDWEHEVEEEDILEIPLVIAEKISCVTIVINGKGGIGALKGMQNLVKTCNKETGRKPSVVVTHKDHMTKDQIEKVKSLLEKEHGIGRERVFVIQNKIDIDTCLEAGSKSRLLDFLERCIADGKAGGSFHSQKEKRHEIRVEYKKKVDAHKAAERKKRNGEAIEISAQELELVRSVQEKLRLEIVTNKEKALVDIDEAIKNDERKHLQNMQKEEEKNYAALQKLEKENELKAMKYAAEMAMKEGSKVCERLAKEGRFFK
ncbi:uncharacterized protein LOC100889477 isoform X1 [Strongylocentrotus purpuratus]|uniref:G domain-containing protein n=1 Tax=Strongylocentrotus purpuratus TaxID=7668 RepID=A0A7M7NDZ1_STRPU|nr:uncharacterized protein LOC100889477 isoform X1 [Strongylocentrotus purpuratus]